MPKKGKAARSGGRKERRLRASSASSSPPPPPLPASPPGSPRGASPPTAARGGGGGGRSRGGTVKGKHRRGLVNLGNTCFLNSILQCLNVSVPFSDHLLALSKEGLAPLGASLSAVFSALRGHEKKAKAVSPKPLLAQLISRFPWYRGGEQQDAHELLRMLLGSISDERTSAERRSLQEQEDGAQGGGEEGGRANAPGQPTSHVEAAVWRSFQGHFCQAVLCWRCGRVSMLVEPFLDVPLELPSSSAACGPLGIPPPAASAAATASSAAVSSGREKAGRSKRASARATAAAAPAEEADEEDDWHPRRGSKKERRRQRSEAAAAAVAAGAAATAAAAPEPPPSPPPPAEEVAAASEAGGAEAAFQAFAPASDEEERLSGVDPATRWLLRLIERVLHWRYVRPLCDGPRPIAEDVAPGAVFEVQLERAERGDGRWGFQWDEDLLADGILELSGIGPGSVLEGWNRKRCDEGQEALTVRLGDRLLSAGGCSQLKQMQKAMKRVSKLTVKFQRGSGAAATGKAPPSGGDSGEEDSRRRHRSLMEEARGCEAGLPEALRLVFGRGGPSPGLRDEAPAEGGANGAFRLQDCLRGFSTVEAIEEDGRPTYECAQCCVSREGGGEAAAAGGASAPAGQRSFATRRAWLWPPLPPLLTLQLKRFRRRGSRFEKSSQGVELPALLDLAPFAFAEAEHDRLRPHFAAASKDFAPPAAPEAGALRYELYGICVHQGSTMHLGHYVAYVNVGPSLEREEWYGCSDAHVWPCSRADALEAEAYVAFYRREGLAEEVAAAQAAAAAEAEHALGSDGGSGASAGEEAEAQAQENASGEEDEAGGSLLTSDLLMAGLLGASGGRRGGRSGGSAASSVGGGFASSGAASCGGSSTAAGCLEDIAADFDAFR